jgi:phosphate-selective porin OprO/OprP
MGRHWCLVFSSALAASLILPSALAGRALAEPWDAEAPQDDLADRVADLEAELARTQAELRRHETRLDAQDGSTGADPVSLTSESAADTAQADGGAKVSEGKVVGSDMNFKARWNNGLLFETPNKDFTMHVGGRFHYDTVFFDPQDSLEAPPPGGFGLWQDGAFIRRLRFQMDGKLWDVFDYNVEMDFAGTAQNSRQDSFDRTAVGREVVLQDVWMQVSELPVVGHFRCGHLKQPMGLESYNSSKFLTFMERGALQDAFLQEYDPGFLFWNNAMQDRLWWGTGCYRIDGEETGIDFGDGEYAWTSRVAFLLWDNPDHRYLFHIGGSYSLRGAEFDPFVAGPPASGTNTDIARFRARPELRGTPRLVDTGAIECSDVDLFGAEVAWVQGPLSVQGEYLLSHLDSARPVATGGAGGDVGDADFHGYYVFVSYFLTGEHRPYDTTIGAFGRVRPHENFFLVRTRDGCCCGLGAWEVAGRWSNVDLNDTGIDGGNLDQFTFGVNWYWNPNMRLMCNYVWSDRDISAPANDGEVHGLGMRASFDF